MTYRLTYTALIITLTNLFRHVDLVGAFTSAAGHGLYTARSWPQEHWNQRAFVAEPTVQLVAEMVLEKEGESFRAAYPRNLIAGDDEGCSPILGAVAPAGPVGLAEW